MKYLQVLYAKNNRNISPFNVFGFHYVVFGSSHFPWSKGKVLHTALESM